MPGTEQFAIVVLCLTALATLWGGIVAGPQRIVPFVFFVGILLLPSHGLYELLLFPDLTRLTAIALPSLVLLLFTPRERWRELRPLLPDALLLAFIAWYAVCVLVNQGSWPAASTFLDMALRMGMPYLAGRLYLTRASDVVALARPILPVALLLLAGVLFELKMSPLLEPSIYGSGSHGMLRYGVWRPHVFSMNSLELGHHLSLLAVVVFALLHAGHARRERHPWLALTFVVLVAATALCLSRGPIMGLLLGIVVPFALKRTGRFALALGALGILFYLWMMSSLGSGAGGAELFVNDPTKDTEASLEYRFLEVDVFKPMVQARPLFGYGEEWERTGPIQIIDGAFLIYTLAAGWPGFACLAAFWLSLCWYSGSRIWPRATTMQVVGAHVAPMLGWLTFTAWGDAFMGVPQHVIAGALVGAAALREPRARAAATVHRVAFAPLSSART